MSSYLSILLAQSSDSDLIVKIVSDDGSWWDTTSASTIIGAGGTLLGAIIGYLFTLLVNRIQKKQKDRERWDVNIREVVTSFLVTVDKMRGDGAPDSQSEEMAALRESLGEFEANIKLICPEEIVTAVQLVTMSILTRLNKNERIPQYAPEINKLIHDVRDRTRTHLVKQ